MKISLCVICGNEAHHIRSMLDSFAECFDELSLVRAIGKTAPDQTELIAREWCEDNKCKFVFSEYKNGVTAQAWKHVDSFARARNQAFSQATGDWLVWADCDDNIAQAEGLYDKLAQVSEDVLMIRCPYDVRGTGKKLPRGSALFVGVRLRLGRIWHHDVHENLAPAAKRSARGLADSGLAPCAAIDQAGEP
jgi:glycosyltransferase involved in cell wall biosynthesis